MKSFSSAKLVAAADPLEVVVGQEVDLLVRLREPADEAAVVAGVVRRHAVIQERACQVDAQETFGCGIPRVGFAIAGPRRQKLYACHVFVGRTTAIRCSPRPARR